MPQTREHILLARPGRRALHGGVPELSATRWKIRSCWTWSELEVRDLLKSYGFPGDDVPVIRGSALKAMDDDPGVDGEDR
jgi:elongation factor Tu